MKKYLKENGKKKKKLGTVSKAEVYLGPCQTSIIEYFANIIDD